MLRRRFSKLNELKDKRTFDLNNYRSRANYRDDNFYKTKKEEEIQEMLHRERAYIEKQLEDFPSLTSPQSVPMFIVVKDREGNEFPVNNNNEEFEDLIDDVGEELLKLFPNEDPQTIEDALFEDIRHNLVMFPSEDDEDDNKGSIFDFFLDTPKEKAIESLRSAKSIIIYSIDEVILQDRISSGIPNWTFDEDLECYRSEFKFLSEEGFGEFYDVILPIIKERRKTAPKIIANAYADYLNGNY